MNWWERFKASLNELVTGKAQEQKFTLADAGMNWSYVNTLVHGPGTPPWGDSGDGDGNSAVFACLMALALAYPEPPITVYTKRASSKRSGRKTPLPNHALQALLDKPTPNGELSIEDLWFWTAWAKHIDGNAYWLKVRSGDAVRGNVVELWPVSPAVISPVTEKDQQGRPREWISYYRMLVAPNEYERVPKENVIHFRLGVDDQDMRRGLSPLKRLARQISTDEEADKFTDTLLKNYAVPGLVVIPGTDVSLNKDDADRIKATMQQNFANDGRGAIAVLSQDSKIEQFGFSPEQMNLSIIHRIPEERIAAVIGVPAIVAGLGVGLDRATFANFKEAREMFTEQRLVPLWRQDAARLNVSLKPDFAQDRNIFVEFDTTDVRALQEDMDKVYTRLDTGVTGKWILRNEARSDVGLDPIAGWDEEDTKPPAAPPPQFQNEEAPNGAKRLPFGSGGYQAAVKQVSPPQTGNTQMDEELSDYHDKITDLCGRALEGEVTESQFRQRMVEITAAAILAMFLLAGGNPNSDNGRVQLAEQQRIARESAWSLADDIYSGRYSGEGEATAALESLEHRLVLWDVTLAGVYAIGQLNKPPTLTPEGETVEARYRWRRGDTKEPCEDCAGLDGVVLTASEWQRMGIRPQDPTLSCGGWNCLCQFVETEEESVGLENVAT